MDSAPSHLVHTEASSPDDSTGLPSENGSSEPSASSSAEERPVHTGEVGGSTPSSRTIDHIAAMLADEQWRLRVEGRFWPKIARPMGWGECWPWTGSTKGGGRGDYGNFKLGGRVNARASRVAYALYYNQSPGPLLVLHSCDNPKCCNPTHLRVGTVQDNSDDMVARGRQARYDGRGEKNRAAKLTQVQVETIRGLIAAGYTNTAIAARFGVTHQLISRIRRGRSWGSEAMQPKYASLRR